MPADFLHGVETIDVDTPGGVLTAVKSSIVALIGIAPKGPVQSLVLCNNADDDAQFGKPLPGFNIPKTLEIIRQLAGSTPLLVVNVFDSGTNLTAVTNEPQTVTNGALKLAFAPIGTVTIKKADGTTGTTLVKDTDYTLDDYGNYKAISTNSDQAESTVLKFSYSKLNAGSVIASQINGAIDGTTEVRTGSTLLDGAYNTYGFKPKILITPGYSTIAAVAANFVGLAATYRAVYLQDAPTGTTVAGAIAGKGVGGAINFNTSSARTMLLYPYLKSYDTATNSKTNYPYSAFMAGVMIANDFENGYWESPSNKNIANALGVERTITWSINDAGSEANQLNAAGITTVAQGFGTGLRTWGNRSALYPSSTDPKNFINIQRTDDIVAESLELAALKYIDKPLTQALIDNVEADGNGFMKELIRKGALLPGSRIVYNKDDNSADELAAGHIVFERIYMVPPPAERITYKSILDISLLNQLK